MTFHLTKSLSLSIFNIFFYYCRHIYFSHSHHPSPVATTHTQKIIHLSVPTFNIQPVFIIFQKQHYISNFSHICQKFIHELIIILYARKNEQFSAKKNNKFVRESP